MNNEKKEHEKWEKNCARRKPYFEMSWAEYNEIVFEEIWLENRWKVEVILFARKEVFVYSKCFTNVLIKLIENAKGK